MISKMNDKCLNCQIEETEFEICDKCFETMETEEWVIPGNNKTGEWKNKNGR